MQEQSNLESILAIDPGWHLGWVKVFFDSNTKMVTLQGAGTIIGMEKVLDWIQEAEADVFVVEDYKIRPPMRDPRNNRRYEHKWDSGDTMRLIGAIQLRARALNAEYVLQQPAVKPAGYGYVGKEYKKNRHDDLVHQDDATAHLAFYLVKNRKCLPDVLRRR